MSLVAVPLLVGFLAAALLLPRPVAPESIPLPDVDEGALERAREVDRRAAAEARRTPLEDDVRALGSALRELNTREARGEDEARLREARSAISASLSDVVARRGLAALARLRAVQLDAFLGEVRRFEATGEQGDELRALGGPFVERMTHVGWCKDHVVLLDDDARRAAYKTAWNGLVGAPAELALTVDETRVLYRFFLTHPHPSETARQSLTTARAAAKDPAGLAAIDAGEALAAEAWRLDRVERLGALDPAYPLAFARGVGEFRLGRYEASARSFRAWIDRHPDGPWSLRARNHLLAAARAADAVR